MEGSESEAIFDSLNLNPQLFLNEVLNSVDDLVDGAFDFFHQQALTILKLEGTDRANDLSKGVAYLRNMVQSVLDKRLSMWEKYCLRHCFTVPEGFSLAKANESAGDGSIELNTLNDEELDVQLDSLRKNLSLVGKETAELSKEIRVLERQSVPDHCAGLVNETLQLYEQHSVHDIFKELIKTVSKLHEKMEQQKAKRIEQTGHLQTGRVHISNEDIFGMYHGNGLTNIKLEELQQFIDDIKNV
ncbi:hypothetical protein NMG60_11023995 [Bertholletia excelsa]